LPIQQQAFITIGRGTGSPPGWPTKEKAKAKEKVTAKY
jgi:hypothetical protein